ncbi:MAG: hypothetical protein AAGH46_12930, partial [Bacteroidota bacterium]
MRKISLALFTTALLTAGTLSANPGKKVQPQTNLSKQIHKMLAVNSFDIDNDLVAQVRFTINKEGEIVVLSVDTKNVGLEGFVKGRLNYQKVQLDQDAQEGKLYTVPVRIA